MTHTTFALFDGIHPAMAAVEDLLQRDETLEDHVSVITHGAGLDVESVLGWILGGVIAAGSIAVVVGALRRRRLLKRGTPPGAPIAEGVVRKIEESA